MAHGELHIPRITILASGDGTTAEACVQGIAEGKIAAEIGLVIASKPSAPILEKVKQWNALWGMDIQSEVVNNRMYPHGPRKRGQSQESAEKICELLKESHTELVLQLGYMVIGNDPYIEEWGFVPARHTGPFAARAFNWHSGLLPLTANTDGEGAAEIMLAAERAGKIEKAGHSVHGVAHAVDAGPVVLETPVPVYPGDSVETLKARVHKTGLEITVQAVNMLLAGRQEYQRRGQGA